MKRLILFLIRRKLGVRKDQCFMFSNQKHKGHYFICSTGLIKVMDGSNAEFSKVSLNWLLDEGCKIKALPKTQFGNY